MFPIADISSGDAKFVIDSWLKRDLFILAIETSNTKTLFCRRIRITVDMNKVMVLCRRKTV